MMIDRVFILFVSVVFVSQVCYEIVGSLALHDGVIIFTVVGDKKYNPNI